MTQNKKIWFFVEGTCEEVFVLWLMRKFYSEVILYNSESEFIKSNMAIACLITDCQSGDKIPFAINDAYYKIEKSHCNIIIVCDLEKSPCVIQRKMKILDKLEEDVDQNLISV